MSSLSKKELSLSTLKPRTTVATQFCRTTNSSRKEKWLLVSGESADKLKTRVEEGSFHADERAQAQVDDLESWGMKNQVQRAIRVPLNGGFCDHQHANIIISLNTHSIVLGE